MSKEAVVPASVPSRHWLVCVLGAFSLAGVVFFVPWERLLETSIDFRPTFRLVLDFLGGVVFWPLSWIASVAGYIAVGLFGIALCWSLVVIPRKRFALRMMVLVYGVLAFLHSLVGQSVQFNSRGLNFLGGPEPTGVFQVIDGLNQQQVAALRAGMLAGVEPSLLFETVTGTAGKSAGYKRNMYYPLGVRGKGSFLRMFTVADNGLQLGPVCEKVRKNYLRSTTTNRYQLTINGTVVTSSAGQCKALGINQVTLAYRGPFAAP